MKVWLIYDEIRYRRNFHYADLYKKHFEKRGIEFELIFVEKLSVSGGEWRYESKKILLPDCAIMRTYALGLSLKLEAYGVRVFNSSKIAEIGNNKYITYEFALKNDIPVMETYLVNLNGNNADLHFPFIMKSLDGHGGNEVFLINDENEYSISCEKLFNKPHIIQKIATETGKDLRVYILGNKIVAGMLRSSSVNFKSNYSLGGKAEKIEIPDEAIKIVNKITDVLNCDFVGIDFIFNDGKAVLNEIEDIVGARMLYDIGLDIVAQYVDYIIAETEQ